MERVKQNHSISFDIKDEPIVFSKILIDVLLKEDKPSDIISLYIFYYYTAKWQKTNQPKATSNYCMNGLKIGYSRFKKAQQKLIDLKLISKIQSRNEKGQIIAWYIKVNFIWKRTTIDRINQIKQNPDQVKPRSSKSNINTLSNNNINTLIKKIIIKKIQKSQFSNFWNIYPKKTDKGKAKTAWDKICNKPNKDKPDWKEIKLAIINQKKSDRWQNSKFIPNPTTWLNQSRWLDDPKEMINYNYDTTEPTGNRTGYTGTDFGPPDEVWE